MIDFYFNTFPVYLCIILFCFVFYILSFGLIKFFKKNISFESSIEVFLIVLGFTLFGFSLGLIVGLSRSPVIAALTPAFLTFIGGFLVFIFVQKNDLLSIQNKITSAFIMVGISISLIYGIEIGARERQNITNVEKINNHLMKMELIEFEHLIRLDYENFKNDTTNHQIKLKSYESIFDRYKQPEEITLEDIQEIYKSEQNN